MASLKPGDRINNYLLQERVGGGSFGEVWRAKHHVFNETVAIKVPTDPQYVRNLQREGMAIHGIRHPNIVRAMDLDPYSDPPYLIMEFVDGPSLRQAMDDFKGTFPIHAAGVILRGVLQALAGAHEAGLIHRDIKPENILLEHPRDAVASIREQAVKVTDFGLGAVGGATSQSMMQSGSMMTEGGKSIAGTLAYMSPEQKEGLPLDARSDLYSCGIVLYEMVTGERPTGTDLPSSVRPGVPAYLDDVFRRSYTRLDRRLSCAKEMLAALLHDHRPPLPPARPLLSREATSNCPVCHSAVERNDQFCIHCGEQLVAAVPRCPACQAFVQSTDRYCIFCGKDLGVLA